MEEETPPTKVSEKAEEKEEKERAKEKDSEEDGKVTAEEMHLPLSCKVALQNPILQKMPKSLRACQKDRPDVQSVDPDGMTGTPVPHSRDVLHSHKRRLDSQWAIHFPFVPTRNLLLCAYLSGYHLNLFTPSIKSHHQLHGYFLLPEEAPVT